MLVWRKRSKVLVRYIQTFTIDIVVTNHSLPTQIFRFSVQQNLWTWLLIFIKIIIDIKTGIDAFFSFGACDDVNY